MDLITNEAKAQADEMIRNFSDSKDIMVAVDMSNQVRYSVRIGEINNRHNNLLLRDTQFLVHALETRVRSNGLKPETHWPSNTGMAHSYHHFKRQNFLY